MSQITGLDANSPDYVKNLTGQMLSLASLGKPGQNAMNSIAETPLFKERNTSIDKYEFYLSAADKDPNRARQMMVEDEQKAKSEGKTLERYRQEKEIDVDVANKKIPIISDTDRSRVESQISDMDKQNLELSIWIAQQKPRFSIDKDKKNWYLSQDGTPYEEGTPQYNAAKNIMDNTETIYNNTIKRNKEEILRLNKLIGGTYKEEQSKSEVPTQRKVITIQQIRDAIKTSKRTDLDPDSDDLKKWYESQGYTVSPDVQPQTSSSTQSQISSTAQNQSSDFSAQIRQYGQPVSNTIYKYGKMNITPQSLPFDDIKDLIARAESGNKKGAAGINTSGKYLGSVDLGKYQINSLNLVEKGAGKGLYTKIDDIFDKYKISSSVGDRVKAVIDNDALNEEIARLIYNTRGIGQWSTAQKVLDEYFQ
jgi:hypothetical protein